jgi:hypothetical protein
MVEENMDVSGFRASLAADAPPSVSRPLLALWHAAKGDWNRAHETVMDDRTQDGAWVHAYLHRVEGDLGNAGYWYRRAGKTVATVPLDAEWTEISTALLGAA